MYYSKTFYDLKFFYHGMIMIIKYRYIDSKTG